ncbi:hypothetical protein [Maritalea porphyrae]|uniref:Uncharacterized protein n=1 Tax=Maritalea porphyrae TaxID=880732 RepID=A0ABQ5UL64_9HYPH|nr:hypothetical protein [Maritalea porphyrae]GLQ16020.1 hypothetical protein GCM10007879_02690 [Maritalea porphyrae]
MFAAMKKNFLDHLIPEAFRTPNCFALTTRDKDGKKLKKPIPLTRQETLARLSEINTNIGKMRQIAHKATIEAKTVTPDSDDARLLAKKCTVALEHCAKISVQNDFFYGSIHSSEDPYMMDRKHTRYAAQLDEIALALSSILKTLCKD